MSLFSRVFSLALLLTLFEFSQAKNLTKPDCVPFAEAGKHLRTDACVSGIVLNVEDASNGMMLIHFCKYTKECPFSVVVFPADTKKVGDLREPEGRQIEIRGTIRDYNSRAEMVLHRAQQLGESAFGVFPQVPTDYDVERQGHYSAEKYSRPKAKKSHKKQGQPISIEDPEEPQ
jgi:hypothetical protein